MVIAQTAASMLHASSFCQARSEALSFDSPLFFTTRGFLCGLEAINKVGTADEEELAAEELASRNHVSTRP
jgi:hypothetical protein